MLLLVKEQLYILEKCIINELGVNLYDLRKRNGNKYVNKIQKLYLVAAHILTEADDISIASSINTKIEVAVEALAEIHLIRDNIFFKLAYEKIEVAYNDKVEKLKRNKAELDKINGTESVVLDTSELTVGDVKRLGAKVLEGSKELYITILDLEVK